MLELQFWLEYKWNIKTVKFSGDLLFVESKKRRFLMLHIEITFSLLIYCYKSPFQWIRIIPFKSQFQQLSFFVTKRILEGKKTSLTVISELKSFSSISTDKENIIHSRTNYFPPLPFTHLFRKSFHYRPFSCHSNKVQEQDEEVDMKFEYRKKILIYPEETHFFPLLFELEFISQH